MLQILCSFRTYIGCTMRLLTGTLVHSCLLGLPMRDITGCGQHIPTLPDGCTGVSFMLVWVRRMLCSQSPQWLIRPSTLSLQLAQESQRAQMQAAGASQICRGRRFTTL